MDKQEFNIGGFEVGHVSVEGGGGGDLSSFANAPMDGPPSTTTATTTSPAGSNRDSLSLDDFEKVDAALLQQIPSHPDPLVASGSPFEAGSMASEEKHQHEQFAPFSAPQDSVPLTFGGSDKTTAASTQDMLVDFMEGPISSAVNSQVTSATSAVQDLLSDFSGSDKGHEPASTSLMDDFAQPKTFAAPAPAMFSMEPPTVVPPSPPAVGEEQDPYTVFSRPVDSHDDDDDHFASEPVHEERFTSSPAAQVNEPAAPVREPSPPPREATPTKEPSFAQPKEPTPPPRTPSPPPKPKEPTPPPREPTPPREPSPPRVPTPPRREPTPPPREPTPPPKEPTPPPRQPTPPPREPTPPPREPTPPPRQPTPPREPTPPPREPTPPAQPKDFTPPPQLVPISKTLVEEVPQQKVAKARRANKVSDSTRASMAIFDPLLDLIYWRNVKITTAVVFGSLGLFIALAYVSFISILAYTSLATLAVTIAYRIYKNIIQAIQKSNEGHPFKTWLEADTSIPFEKMHDASDVFVDQFNTFLAEMKRLFLVEDLVDSIKFGCLLWCLTYVGYWFNGLTLLIIHLVAMFSLPKIYEVNKKQIDYHVGFLRNWFGDLLGKMKGALPVGKEKAQ